MTRTHAHRSTAIVPRLVLLALLAVAARLPLAAQGYSEHDADAVYLDVTHDWTLQPDGGIVYTYEHHLQYLTNFAFTRAYGETFIVTNPQWQTLAIQTAATKMADGKDVAAPFNAFNEVLPGFAHNIAPYSHLREMVVTHTGLESNAVVHLKYTITTKPGMLPCLVGRVLLGDRSPVRKMTVIVRVPENLRLRYALAGQKDGHRENVQDGVTTHTWDLADLPLAPVESHQPGLWESSPVLSFSTQEPRILARHMLRNESALYTLDPRARAAVAEAARSKQGSLEKIAALRTLLDASVVEMRVDLALLGYLPLPAQSCWDRAAGSPLDRAVLLAAMLRSAGMDAVPVLCGPATDGKAQAAGQADISAATFFTQLMPAVLCRGVDGAGRDVVVDPSGEQYGPWAPRLAGRPYVVVEGDCGVTGTVPAAAGPRQVSLRSAWKLDAAGAITGSGTLLLGGPASLPYLRDKERLTKAVRASQDRSEPGFATKDEVPQADKGTQATCSFALSSKNPLAWNGNLATLVPPQPPHGFAEQHLVLPSTPRLTAVQTTGPLSEESDWTVEIPRGCEFAGKPAARTVANALGSVTVTVTESGATSVRVLRKLELRASVVPADQYAALRELLLAWTDPAAVAITLRKRPS